LFRKVALIGVGLLGGSLGLALRQRRLAGRVSGYVRRPSVADAALAAGAVDCAATDLAGVVRDAELVVFCTPLGQMAPLAREAARHLPPNALATDEGSVKARVVQDLEPVLDAAGAHFVGSHPMAGSERTGVGAARADLFERAVCVITPTATTPLDAVEQTAALWRAVGGRVLPMSPGEHDRFVARTSHLPQAVAVTLANLVLDPAAPADQSRLCAGGFRDATRIASGSPEMWRDILLANRDAVAETLREFSGRLAALQQVVEAADAVALDALLTAAKQRRDHWLQEHRGPSPS
jgi:prephenate dehydrogenase